MGDVAPQRTGLVIAVLGLLGGCGGVVIIERPGCTERSVEIIREDGSSVKTERRCAPGKEG